MGITITLAMQLVADNLYCYSVQAPALRETIAFHQVIYKFFSELHGKGKFLIYLLLPLPYF